MLTWLLVAAGGYAALVAGMYVFQRNLMYLPSASMPSPAASGVGEMRTVTLHTEDGLELAAWYRPARPGRATIVYFHGNAGHLGYRAGRVRPYLDAGYGVLLVEYRGYGGNPGRPSEEGLYRDGRAALAYLAGGGVAVRCLVLYGESLGGGVAVQLAVEQARKGTPAGAVVLEAPLTSVADIGARHMPFVPVRTLLKDRFNILAKVVEIEAPLLIVHGENDRVVPIGSGRALYAAALPPKDSLWVAGGGHEDLDRFGLQQVVIAFVERHVSRGCAGEG